MVNKQWKGVAGSDNEVDEHELAAAMENHSLAQKKGGKKPKKGGPHPPTDDEGSGPEHPPIPGTSDEGSGSEPEHPPTSDESEEHKHPHPPTDDEGAPVEPPMSGDEGDHEHPPHGGPPTDDEGGAPVEPAAALAQKGPSAKQIMDACDADKSGGLTLDEAHACIDAHVTDEEDNAKAH